MRFEGAREGTVDDVDPNILERVGFGLSTQEVLQLARRCIVPPIGSKHAP
jgi:hypothetical protein